jgi:hypothetical protein
LFAKTVFCRTAKGSSTQLMVCFYHIVNISAEWNEGNNPHVFSVFVYVINAYSQMEVFGNLLQIM